jgi:hypothetical protein
VAAFLLALRVCRPISRVSEHKALTAFCSLGTKRRGRLFMNEKRRAISVVAAAPARMKMFTANIRSGPDPGQIVVFPF